MIVRMMVLTLIMLVIIVILILILNVRKPLIVKENIYQKMK